MWDTAEQTSRHLSHEMPCTTRWPRSPHLPPVQRHLRLHPCSRCPARPPAATSSSSCANRFPAGSARGAADSPA